MEYYSLGQFSKKVGLSRGRIQELAKSGYIKRVPISRTVTYPEIPETELEKFGGPLDTRYVKSTTKYPQALEVEESNA